MRIVRVIGHRGCAGLLPENTIDGFLHAIALGVDGVECDVHLTSDRRLVVMHDDTLDRTTDGSGPIDALSFDAVRRLDAGGGRTVPTLDEVLEVVAAGGVTLLCELKGEGTEAAAVDAVRRHGLLDRVTFTCFTLERIVEARRIAPQARTGAIFSDAAPGCVERAAAAGASGMGVQFRRLTAEVVRQARDAGLEIRAWNPDEEPDQRAVIALAPDGISTNRPDRLLALLGRGRRAKR